MEQEIDYAFQKSSLAKHRKCESRSKINTHRHRHTHTHRQTHTHTHTHGRATDQTSGNTPQHGSEPGGDPVSPQRRRRRKKRRLRLQHFNLFDPSSCSAIQKYSWTGNSVHRINIQFVKL